MPPDKRLYAQPWSTFCELFREDVEAFLDRGTNPDVFSDSYRKRLAPRTVAKQRQGLQQVATALVGSGFPPDRLCSLADLVKVENAKAALQQLHRERGGKKEYLAWQARLLVTVARQWVQDGATADALKQLPPRLFDKSPGMRPKNRRRLRQFDLPSNVDALLTLPARVIGRAEKVSTPTGKEARDVLFALVVELLLVTALRINNLTLLRRGATLIETGHGRNRCWHVAIPPNESKTGRPLDIQLPPSSGAMLELFWDKYRPLIGARDTIYLFATKTHDHRSPISFGTQIKRFIAREIGIEMNVHLFRHLAAKLYLAKHPHGVETIRRLLGHTSSATTMRAYAELQSEAAFARWDEVLTRFRTDREPPLPPKPRKAKPEPRS